MRGGKRANAGRPASAKTKRIRDAALTAASVGMTPIEVMLGAMRKQWDVGQYVDAASIAKDAAPYIHPRLASVTHSGPDGGPVEHTHTVAWEVIDPVQGKT